MRAAQHPRVNSVGAHALSPTEWHPCRPAAEVEPQHLPHDHVEGDNDRHADQAATGIVCSGAAGMCCLVRRGGEPQRRQREIYDNGNSAAVLPYVPAATPYCSLGSYGCRYSCKTASSEAWRRAPESGTLSPRPDITVLCSLVHTRQVHRRPRRCTAISEISNWSGIALHKIADRSRIAEPADQSTTGGHTPLRRRVGLFVVRRCYELILAGAKLFEG
jgi:hypothetical protein